MCRCDGLWRAQTGAEIDRQIDRQTDRQTDIFVYREVGMCECVFEKNTEPQPWRIENNFLVHFLHFLTSPIVEVDISDIGIISGIANMVKAI